MGPHAAGAAHSSACTGAVGAARLPQGVFTCVHTCMCECICMYTEAIHMPHLSPCLAAAMLIKTCAMSGILYVRCLIWELLIKQTYINQALLLDP